MKIWFCLCLSILCKSFEYKIGAPISTITGLPTIMSRVGGFDHRFEQNFTDDPDFSPRFQRYLQIQQQIRTLENPSLTIQLRASLAKEWLFDDDCRIRQPNIILQLWEDWNADSPPLDHDDDTLGDAASTFPTTSV